jgi:hypothetical protein
MLTILVLKLLEMFKMQTVFSTSNTTVNQDYPVVTLSTYPNDTQYTPYMVAVLAVGAGCHYNHTIRAFHYKYVNLSTPH